MNKLYRKVGFVFFCLNIIHFCGYNQLNSNWHFGTRAALKFTTAGPVAVTGSQIVTSEGCATMSDSNGDLLFYTDGVTVWNKSNSIMFNGTGLRGGASSSQSSIIVPAPGNVNKFYLFTSTPVEGNPIGVRDYCYNIIDMGLRGGLGEVVVKNVVFDTSCSERLTAANHANGLDFWIITNTVTSRTFKSFSLTANGLSAMPVVNNVGDSVQGGIGLCKVSPDGNWLIQTFSKPGQASAQLFKFNNANGVISNPISLLTSFNCTYGCAFSPNATRLYIGGGFCSGNPLNKLLQFSLFDTSTASILGSKTEVNLNSGTTLIGDMSIGMDAKMYIAKPGRSVVSRIENPNDTATNLIYIDAAVLLTSGSLVALGLPNNYNSINLPPPTINVDTLSCLTYKFTFLRSNKVKGVYTWLFGDGGGISSDSTPTYTYKRSTNDSFLVKLNFRSDDNTISINQELWLKIPPKPIARFTVGNSGCLNDSVRLNNNSTTLNGSITESIWSFGDGTSSNVFEPRKRFAKLQTYNITLVVKDSLGCISDTATSIVVIDKSVTVNFNIQGNYCTGSPLNIIDSSNTNNTSINNWWFSWNNGGIYTSTTSGNFNATFNTEELYTLMAVVNTVEGCKSDTVMKSFFVNNTPKANFVLPKSCILDVSNFNSLSTINGLSFINYYKWDFGVPSISSDTSRLPNASYQYNNSAVYPVSLTVKTNRGCSNTITQNFTVNGAIPKAQISFLQNPVCGNDSVVLINRSTVDFGSIEQLDINWQLNSITVNNPQIGSQYKNKYAAFGTPVSEVKQIKIKAFSGISCVSELDTFIVIKSQPKVSFALPISSICGNEMPIALNQGLESSGAFGSFTYSGLAVQQLTNSQFVFNPKLAPVNTVINITYKFSTPENCFDTLTAQLKILPFPKVSGGPDRIIVNREKILLLATAQGSNLKFSWFPPALTNNPNFLQPLVSSERDTTFIITAINDIGCEDSSKVNVNVLPPVNPPNAFSPNNDGINDTWIIKSLIRYTNCDVVIFNRYGQKVFTSTGYNLPWDGKINGLVLPPATYYYVIDLKTGKPPVTGWVQLLK
jgi:gliding motility-associated-like protein